MLLYEFTPAHLRGMTPQEFLSRPGWTPDGLTPTMRGILAIVPAKHQPPGQPTEYALHLVQRRSVLLQRALASAPYPYAEPTPKDRYRDLLRSLRIGEDQIAAALGFKNLLSLQNSGRYKRGEIQRDVLALHGLLAPAISAETASRYNIPPPTH